MKKILLIEDDEFKFNSIRNLVLQFNSKFYIDGARSLVEAVDAINSSEYDLILIDMSIPSHPIVSGEGSPISLLTGGLEVIFELNYLHRSDRCVIITQYPEIEICDKFYSLEESVDAIRENYDCVVSSCIEYKEDSTAWKELLNNELTNI